MELLRSYLSDQTNLKPKMVCELLHLIHGILSLENNSDLVDWDEMKTILEKLRAKVPKNRHFQEVKKAFNKVSVPLKIQVVQDSDKKSRQDENGFELSENNVVSNGKKSKNKKKKKKQSNETLQKRKERKKFELEDQYKDLELPSFKSSLVDNINADETAEPPKKKKKVKSKAWINDYYFEFYFMCFFVEKLDIRFMVDTTNVLALKGTQKHI